MAASIKSSAHSADSFGRDGKWRCHRRPRPHRAGGRDAVLRPATQVAPLAKSGVPAPNARLAAKTFDKVAKEMEECTNRIAERSMEIGGIALSTI
jgi:hypothetical protein